MVRRMIVLQARQYTHFWTLLKSGDLRQQEKAPAGNKPHVREIVTYLKEQHSRHLFQSSTNETTLDAWCGQDRGPRRAAIIRQMLKSEVR